MGVVRVLYGGSLCGMSHALYITAWHNCNHHTLELRQHYGCTAVYRNDPTNRTGMPEAYEQIRLLFMLSRTRPSAPDMRWLKDLRRMTLRSCALLGDMSCTPNTQTERLSVCICTRLLYGNSPLQIILRVLHFVLSSRLLDSTSRRSSYRLTSGLGLLCFHSI